MRSTKVLVCMVLAVGLSASAVAQGQGHGKGKGNQVKEDVRADEGTSVRVGPIVFSSHDREIIRDYYRGGTSNLPPGLAKRGGKLPPGLEKQLQKNGKLPPGLQKKLTPFPTDLERRLPRLPDIYRRGTIDGNIVIVDRKTQRVMDVIYDILRP